MYHAAVLCRERIPSCQSMAFSLCFVWSFDIDVTVDELVSVVYATYLYAHLLITDRKFTAVGLVSLPPYHPCLRASTGQTVVLRKFGVRWRACLAFQKSHGICWPASMDLRPAVSIPGLNDTVIYA